MVWCLKSLPSLYLTLGCWSSGAPLHLSVLGSSQQVEVLFVGMGVQSGEGTKEKEVGTDVLRTHVVIASER